MAPSHRRHTLRPLTCADIQWEYVDVKEFHNDSWSTRIKYVFVYLFLIKNVAIYGLDIFTAATMLATDNVSTRHPESELTPLVDQQPVHQV